MYVTFFVPWSIAPSVPCDGPATFESVSASPSGSVQASCELGRGRAHHRLRHRLARGAVFGGATTVIETVAAGEVAVPSVAR